MSKTRRRIPGEEKIRILRRLLMERVAISDLSDEHQVLPTQIYQWQKQLFESGAKVFERSGDNGKAKQTAYERKIAKLEERIRDRNEVVAELLQEHVQLKKELGEP